MRQKAILVGLRLPSDTMHDVEESLDELAQLADTAGAVVADVVVQEREGIHPRTYIGPGKAEQIGGLVGSLDIDLVILNHDLSPSQQRNLEDIIGRMIIDRTGLILDIFAQHAHSKEGSIQVELAQCTYRLPGLRGKGIEMSRLGGGIGTRGPGETKLEVDRRRIQQRIRRLKKELVHMGKVRETQAKRRRKACTFAITMVGYTNAGKSTLLNLLTHAGVLVEDRLFATLDSTTRQLMLPNTKKVVISDTVGFIRELPHQLVAAFKSTLEGIRESDLLLHIVDLSAENYRENMHAVYEVLKEIGAAEKNHITVFNKTDAIGSDIIERAKKEYPDSVCMSALKGEGADVLLDAIQEYVETWTCRSLGDTP